MKNKYTMSENDALTKARNLWGKQACVYAMQTEKGTRYAVGTNSKHTNNSLFPGMFFFAAKGEGLSWRGAFQSATHRDKKAKLSRVKSNKKSKLRNQKTISKGIS